MSDREKFIVATLLVKNSDLEENPGITIRKTGDFITLYISRENHLQTTVLQNQKSIVLIETVR